MKPMTDRELLELAAKAAGIDWFDEPAAKQGRGLHMKHGPFWNPLADDGDALRLMVALKLEPRFIDNGGTVENSRVVFHNISGVVVDWGDDLLAATRRAIVRAAAEIGRDIHERLAKPTCKQSLQVAEQQGPEHISSPDCWCHPELDYKDPETGAEVWVHKELQ